MEAKKPRLRYPVIVEGKYDKIKLDSLFEGEIFASDGFRIFKNGEKQALFRALAKETPLLIATDPDGAGKLIRRQFTDSIPADRLIPVYLPQIPGKERRKDAPSKEGYLGLEGLDADTLRQVFAPYLGEETAPSRTPLTKADLMTLGLSGGEGSAEKRAALCRALRFPQDLSCPALLRALNVLYGKEKFLAYLEENPI